MNSHISTSSSVFDGGCLCGAVRYRIEGEPLKFYHCHCSRCRRATGTGHASNLQIKPGTLRWTQGEDLLRNYKVPESERFNRVFCGECGAAVPRFVKETGMFVIPAGTLDAEPPIQPQGRIFWDSRALWSCDDTDLPTFAEFP